MMRFLTSLVLIWTTAAAAQDASWRFEWQGADGYSMRGALSVPVGMTTGIVREGDVSCFETEGFHEGRFLGRFDLSMLAPDTVWRLHFFPRDNRFLVEGEIVDMPQAWNMAGDGTGCGEGGFGFNLGNIAQDICLDDEVILESQTSPFAPFPAVRDDTHLFSPGACRGALLLGALR